MYSWEDPSRPTISFPWAVLCVVDYLSLILVGHSKGKTHETMKRRQVHHTSTSNDFQAALFLDEYPRPSIDVCTIGNSPTLHTNLSEPHLSVQLWVGKLSKSCQHFLNRLVKEKQLWQVNVLSPRMPLYGTLSLFRTSFAGCYTFPCVSLGCDVSTCKPYGKCELIANFSAAMVTSPRRERREVWREKRKVRIFGKGKCSSSPIVRIFGKGKCKFIANFSATRVTSLPSISLSLSHRKYLTHNIGSASALPIILLGIGW